MGLYCIMCKHVLYQVNCTQLHIEYRIEAETGWPTCLQMTFSNAFSWMKIYEFWLKFHWSLFLRFQLTIYHHWFRYWLGAVQATSHYLNQGWPSSLTHIYISQPQWDIHIHTHTYITGLPSSQSLHTITYRIYTHTHIYITGLPSVSPHNYI